MDKLLNEIELRNQTNQARYIITRTRRSVSRSRIPIIKTEGLIKQNALNIKNF